MPANDESRQQTQSTARRVSLHSALQLLTVLGLVVFVALRIPYTSFYRPLGVEPEEVGLTYTDTLERAAVGLVVLGVSWVVFVAIHVGASLALDVFKGGAARAVARARGKPPTDWRIGFDLVGSSSSYAVVVAVGLLFALLPYTANELSGDVRRGEAISPRAFDRDNPLGLRALPARVQWLAETNAQPIGSQQIFYLGQADGVTVLFQPSSDEVIRVPSGSVVVRLVTDP
jgi:hypothetical protein